MQDDDWDIPSDIQPQPSDYSFDVRRALSAVVGLRSVIPADAFTADILGTERAGHGVVIRDRGIVLTVGYLITEASEVWVTLDDGRTLAAHPIGYDQETGFGLVQILSREELPALDLGRSEAASPSASVIAAGAGGLTSAVAAQVVARQEFAGYWEYVLEDAIFTAPAHPFWGGTGLIDENGDLIGIGSLQLEQTLRGGETMPLNMYVPTDLLRPILDDMLQMGQANRPPRPWLGLYATEVDDRVVIAGVAGQGPAAEANVREGDIVMTVGDREVTGLAQLFRSIWSLGAAGVEVPLTVNRDGEPVDLTVMSGDRNRYLKGPSLH